MESNQDDDLEGVYLGCALEYFSEHNEIIEIINNVSNICDDSIKCEKSLERFNKVITQYKEQAHLLDSHLDVILDAIISIVRNMNVPMNIKNIVFKYLFLIVNVRGYKVIVKKLPHEVVDVKPVLCMLEEQDTKDKNTWETRYCLLLWLSIIVKIPFDMSRFDCGDVGDKGIMRRILDICHTYVLIGDTCNKMAAYLVSQFITRLDVKTVYLEPFLRWCMEYVKNRKNTDFAIFGPLSAISSILKFGKREDLLPHSDYLLNSLMTLDFRHGASKSYRLERKFYVKIVQRLGLTFLKVRIAKWRYKRGNRILCINQKTEDTAKEQTAFEDSDDEDEDIEVVSQVEDVINELFEALRDEDITVRWSAAKGIGRVTNRLPKGLADDIIATVLDYLSPREKDPAWHGACLALAELGKRGLLLSHRLPEAVSCILKALVYDEPKGFCSVGSYIRDAACYVCWAFARAYDPKTLDPFVQDIATGLLIVTCYDKEINCRRAASAAFQELVGRQGGTLPNGIDILTRADYFTVGVRTSSYLDISIYIAQFKEYTRPFINHLLERKVAHWDLEIRKLTAKTLHKMVPYDPEYFVNFVVDALLKKINSIDLNGRHGATLCIGEVVHALVLIKRDLPEDKWIQVKNIIQNFRDKKQLQGLSGEMTKQACCYMIEQLCLANLTCGDSSWLDLINECLVHDSSVVQTQACQALEALCNFYKDDNTGDSYSQLVTQYIDKLKSQDQLSREGHALAFATIPAFMLRTHCDIIIPTLIETSQITDTTTGWAMSRKHALDALTSITQKLSKDPVLIQYIPALFECHFVGVKEYTKDSRGDIGRFVRETSMNGLKVLIQTCLELDPKSLTEDHVRFSMCSLAKQSVERIDHTRSVAGKIFYSLLHSSQPEVPYIPHRSDLMAIFKPDLINSIEWNNEADTFPIFTQMLLLETYTHDLLSGLVMSIGGVSERLVTCSSKSFLSFLKDQSMENLVKICDVIVMLFKENSKNEDMIISLLLFMEKMFGAYFVVQTLEESGSPFPKTIMELVRMELVGCKKVAILKASIDVYCQLLQFSSVRRTTLSKLLIFLNHSVGCIRHHVATRLHETIVIMSEEMEEHGTVSDAEIQDSLELLSDTDWMYMDKTELKDIRNKIFQLYHLKVPTAVKK